MKSYLEDAPEWDYLNKEVEKIVIGDEVTTIGDGAFMYFTNLKEVKLGDSIEYIGVRSFDFCTSLSTINFPNNIKYIGDFAFNKTIITMKKCIIKSKISNIFYIIWKINC